MYYEEKIIDGVLHCRKAPDDEWEVVSPENMTLNIERLAAERDRYKTEYEDTASAAMELGVRYAELQAEVASLKKQLAARERKINRLEKQMEYLTREIEIPEVPAQRTK